MNLSKGLKRLIGVPIIQPVELDDFLPLKEAAEIHKVSTDTLYRLIAARKLARYRRQGDKRIWLRKSELEAFFKLKRVED